MKFKPTMESTYFCIKFILSAFSCWPLPADAKPSQVRWHNRWWWFLFIHLIVSSCMILRTIYLSLDDMYFAIQVTTECALFVSTLLKMVISKVEAPRLQGLIAELEEFLERATAKEMQLIQSYLDKCTLYSVVIFFIVLFEDIGIIIATTFSPRPLPQSTTYPFSIEPFWIWASLYASHWLIILHSDAMIILSLEYTILLWITAARFEVICSEFENALNFDDLKRCVRKHQRLIEYSERLSKTTAIMATHVLSLAVLGVTTGGFMLIYSNLDWSEVVKYVVFFVGALILFHMLAWPADNLIDTSEKVLQSVYNSAWINKPEMLKATLIIGQRSRSPIIIAVSGLFPALSLELFASAVSASFSYLAMLRTVAGDKKEPEENLRSHEDFDNLL